MRNSDKLTELTEQASLAINTLSPTDLSEVGSLQEILGRISESIAEIKDAPVELLEQAKGETSSSVEALHKILQQDVEDTSQAIEMVSHAVVTLQSLVAQVSESAVAPDPEQTQGAAPEEAETVIPEDDLPLVLDFIAEAYEHIESAEAGLLDLESKPDDSEVLNQIFRAFHTIKGMAGFLNLSEIGSLAHSAENLLDNARKGELVLAGTNSDAVFESIDMLKRMIAGLKESVESGEPVPAQEGLPNLLAKLKASVESKGVEEFLATPEGQKKDEDLDEILCVEGKVEIRETTTKARGSSGDEKIKVSTARLDNLINMAGELVIAQLMVTEEVGRALAVEQDLSRKIAHQSKIVRELQELSMSMRMVPIHGVFQKMARLVRDLSHKAGKDVAFSTVGDDTELDRNIVDKIADPLVHMVRNSVDHGIEPRAERTKAGKNPNGQLELRAFHQAGDIVIEIEDDGRGLDKERILEKAISNGIVEPGQELSEEEIHKLIFHAGLSTAKQVTSVSGRGVGMDVVKKNIEALHGKIEIDSKLGVGTTFTVRLPLTLAIIDGQIVKVSGESYIIPINSIVRSLRPKREQISSVQSRGEMVMIRGKLLPLVRLYELFGVVPTTEDPTEALLMVVEEDNNRCCLLVDELLGQQQVVIKSLGEGLGSVKGVSGGAIMGDGRVRLILDVPSVMKLAYNGAGFRS
ncbi:MAG: chemotaxis protein CheA [Planctomycetota bacterium]